MTTSPFQAPSFRISQLAPLTLRTWAAISRFVTGGWRIPESVRALKTTRPDDAALRYTRAATIRVICWLRAFPARIRARRSCRRRTAGAGLVGVAPARRQPAAGADAVVAADLVGRHG